MIGDAESLAIGEWQISRVYADLKQAEFSLLFAKSSLELVIKNNLTQLLPSAYEGIARAYAIARQPQLVRDYIVKARKELDSIRDEEDKKIYAGQINETESLLELK